MSHIQTIGQVLVKDTLPEDMKDSLRPMDKKEINRVFTELAKRYPKKYIDILQNMNDIGRKVATYSTEESSISLNDLETPLKYKAIQAKMRKHIDQIAQSDKLTSKQKNDAIFKYTMSLSDDIKKGILSEAYKDNNNLAKQAKLGVRGNAGQLSQILYGDLLLADQKGKPVPIVGLHGYAEGITPAEMWAGSYGSRAGYYAVQFATAASGFLGKQLAAVAGDVVVSDKDCGTTGVGEVVDGSDPNILGKALAAPIAGLAENHVITKADLKLLHGKKPIIRTVHTCQSSEGVCQKCVGTLDNGKFPAVGSRIGVDSARMVSEPLTQMGLSEKHTGGAIGATDVKLAGFEGINQMFQVPKNFKGGAHVTPITGTITSIDKAPQGGHYIHVNDTQIYTPEGIDPKVKVGQEVDAGDILTNGTPNPADITKYKGIGEGRKYFADTLYDMLKSKSDIKKEHLQTISRGFIDKIKFKKDSHDGNYDIDDITSYSAFSKGYTPRASAQETNLVQSKGRYLEAPILHYTIGTKLDRSMLNNLKEAGISKVMTSQEEPEFEPVVIRPMDYTTKHSDWKNRLGGWNIKKGFLDSVQHGGISKNEGTSAIPKLMNPVLYDK